MGCLHLESPQPMAMCEYYLNLYTKSNHKGQYMVMGLIKLKSITFYYTVILLRIQYLHLKNYNIIE